MTKHFIHLGAPRDMTGGARPVVLQRSDDDFIEATLDDLRTAAGRSALNGMRAKAGGGALKLYQPIQRLFHVAVLEAWCDQPGARRIDPARVIAAGMVLRRIGKGGREGWMRSQGRIRGWVPLHRVGGDAADPASVERLQRGLTGQADLDRQLAGFAGEKADSRLDEHVIPLYLAPPDVCGDADKTIYYGIVPTTSSELSEGEAAAAGDDGFGPKSAAFLGHLAGALGGKEMKFPFPGETLAPGWLDALEGSGDEPPAGVSEEQFKALVEDPSATGSEGARMRVFMKMLHQLGSEFNAFAGGKETDALKKKLRAIQLPLVKRDDDDGQRSVCAYDFLAAAAAILLERDKGAAAPEMPESWPAATDDQLARALHQAMTARMAALKGKSGRFDDPKARYVLRAFVRARCNETGCTRVFWSDETEPIVIAPWYEGGGAPPIQIPLPDATDKAMLKALKPNVAFVVPPSMQNLLGGKAKDLMDGKGDTLGLELAWICGFNIPLITICAFMVLNVFFSLFNLVFGWLPFLKICLPAPKLTPKPPQP